ncbi:ribokinase-like isoform X2 [Pollicipes pollicipes]|nr:ribokinase-like isoform X2 [Pollicipes pollicipes]XP_037085191.1 ribokinase-like isoform X2 [Pollicipes pollicipes]XP_037085200.1 ribokinase-like isoform X2 [Pollicipes pollicipes]
MDIIVIGSCMTDQICYTSRLPKPGETIHGTKFSMSFGGKGANQCVMAAKLGAKTAMVAKLGEDTFGRLYLDNLLRCGVDVGHTTTSGAAATGVAQICVDEAGMNSIVIVAGANLELSAADVARADGLLGSARVLLCQLEVPLETTLAALRAARRHGVTTVVNAAPAQPVKDGDLFELSDIFCVNETEAEIMTELPVRSVAEAETAAAALLRRGCRAVIVTLGAQGAVYAAPGQAAMHVPAERAERVVDTTGAGDAFLGALGYFLACVPALPVREAIVRACRIATDSVARPGTQDSFPSREQLPAELLRP